MKISRPFIVIESGSSKTELHYSEQSDVLITKGINPYLLNESEIENRLEKIDLKSFVDTKTLLFFGAGIDHPKCVEKLEKVFRKMLPNMENTYFKNDLEAAYLAFYPNEPAHIGILGTGSNSGIYDGEKFYSIQPGMGYLLGDEGAGTYIGRHFIRGLYYGRYGQELVSVFENKFNCNLNTLKTKLYTGTHIESNQLLASFLPFIGDNQSNPNVYKLLYDAFETFLKNRVLDSHPCRNLYLVGSISYFFRDIIAEVASDIGINLVKVIQKPGRLVTLRCLELCTVDQT